MIYTKLDIDIDIDQKRIENWNYSSAIRGIFGRTIKDIFCIQRNIICNACSFKDCLYYELFEKKYGNYQRFHPYILQDITPDKNTNTLVIQITFIGKICEQISQLLHGLLRMQKYALIAARNSSKIMIKKITDQTGNVIYKENVGKLEMPIISEAIIEKQPVKKINLHIETPFRVKYNNKLLQSFVWHAFLQTLYNRLKYLNQNYCSSSVKLHLLEKDFDVKVSADNTYWKEQFRKSYIQNQKMSFGGLVGDVVLENINEDTYALLKLGEIFHVGKQTTFGLGKYTIEILE